MTISTGRPTIPRRSSWTARGRLWVIPWQLISQNTTTDITERLETEARRISYEGLKEEIDFAFLSLHGKFGEDGCMQGLLELLGIPYTGPGVLASALGMDKHIQQRILQAAGIGVPESVLIHEAEWRNDREGVIRSLFARFKPPCLYEAPARRLQHRRHTGPGRSILRRRHRRGPEMGSGRPR